MEKLSLVLKPRWENDTVVDIEVSSSIETSVFSSAPALFYCAEGWLCVPFAVYDSFEISDDLGPVPYVDRKATSMWGIEVNGLFFERPLQGNLKWSYRIFPRVLPEGYRSSPYYDFRAEPFGANGSVGFAFILPPIQSQFRVALHWDMSRMPKEARAVSSLGAGDFEIDTDGWTFRTCYFATGIMNAEENEEFGIYWFGEPTFEIRPATKRLRELFTYMCDFFQDTNPTYRIFLRRDPFEQSGGGSGGTRSFMSGYSASGTVDTDDWFCVLAHEMVHNWPRMDDSTVGTGTWYTEGTAEYYSAVLPYKAGIVDAEETARQINKKAKRYLDNPFRYLSSMEIPPIEWKDRRAQTVPYGRGMLYLANVEAQLRRLGKGSIDDITVLFYEHNMMQPADWEAFIRERLGAEGIQDFEEMKAGKLIVPDPDSFGGYFTVTEKEIELNGKMEKTYEWSVRKA